ncbi:MAG: hypothetical protein KAI33_08190 [Elusimicrobiales bacterium]|nr:hypothetical protein [Elusimicrobiales bacterium]
MNLTQRVSFGSSDPEAIKKHLNALKRHKNRIEKALETKRALSSFSVKNCEEIEKMAFTCGNLLLKMGKKSSSKINISRIKAAGLAAWQLAFETVKLKSIIWDGKGNKTKVYSQLSKVEASSGKLEVHLNALLASL